MQQPSPTHPRSDGRRADRQAFRGSLRWFAALLTAGSAAIHLAVAPAHFQEYIPFGVAFVLAAAAQLALAGAVLMAPSRRLLAAAAAGTAGLVAVWLVSRTAGLPVGPRPRVPEPAGVVDVVCTAMELLSLVAFLV